MIIDFYPAHMVRDPVEQAANLAWFEEQWRVLKLGKLMITDAGAYAKTEAGFRRATDDEVVVALQEMGNQLANS